MNYLDASFVDPDGGTIGTAQVPDTPDGWWTYGSLVVDNQSWDRPFSLNLTANRSRDFEGPSLFADTGEAFSHFEQPQQTAPNVGIAEGMLGSGAFGFPAIPMPPMPEFHMPLPHTGRPERPFPGIGGYLDACARQTVVNACGEERPLRLIGETLVGESERQAAERERKATSKAAFDFSAINGQMFTYVVNKVMSRTVMRAWEFADDNDTPWILFIGARMQGHDLLRFPSALQITSLPNGGYPFGQAPLNGADLYEVSWMASARFGGACPKDGTDLDEYLRFVARFGTTARFDDALMAEMRKREQAYRRQDSEQHRRDIAGMRQLSQEMHEDNRRAQERLEWERARSWERRQESDRRIREGWSAVNRGVEQYRGPYGELIEIPISGPNTRAYYDRFSGTILHTDGYVSGWEELPRWQW